MKMHFMLFEVEHSEEIKKLEHNDLRFIKFSEWDNLCFCEACDPIKKFIGEYWWILLEDLCILCFFDDKKYVETQSKHILERISQFDNKLYLEFAASFLTMSMPAEFTRFQPDSKLKMLLQVKEQAEIVISVNANDIEQNKQRKDYEQVAICSFSFDRCIQRSWFIC